jgi:hypothetical protein
MASAGLLLNSYGHFVEKDHPDLHHSTYGTIESGTLVNFALSILS